MPCKGKPFKSKLIPYLDRIRSMRKGGASYTEIAEALNREYDIGTHRSTVHDFVRVRAKGLKPVYVLPEEEASCAKASKPAAGMKDAKGNVFAALRSAAKERAENAKRHEGGFTFDETKPIT